MTKASIFSDIMTRFTNEGVEPRRRRALVLTNDAARHPFRASLPPHVTRDLIPVPAEDLWRLTKEDVRGAVSVYIATTAAVLAFII